MARFSQHAQILHRFRRLRRMLYFAVHDGDSGLRADHEAASDLVAELECTRYINRGKTNRRVHKQKQKCKELLRLDDVDFRRHFRVTKAEFKIILSWIEDDEDFQLPEPKHPNARRRQSPKALLWLGPPGSSRP
ncbi:hypothetical protein V8E36_005540 [Tilletia maclaganii]